MQIYPTIAPPAYTPDELWPVALAELRLQMTKATFNAWLADSCVISEASNLPFLVISVRNQYAHEWLTYRLQPVIVRTLTGIAGYKVEVYFIPKTLRAMRKSCHEPTRRLPA
jgi:chromosomal replication initiation ATPase DnaA